MKLQKLLLIFLLVIFASHAIAQSSSQLKRKKEAIQREIELLQKNLNKAEKSKKLTLSEIRAINTKIRLMQNKITVINSEVKSLDNEIHENTNTVHSLQEQLAQLKKEYAGMIRFAQRNKNAYDKMMFIFSAKDFNQAYKRIKYLQQFGQYRKKQAKYIQGTEKKLNNKIAILDKSLKEKSELLKEQQNEKDKLSKNKTKQSAVLNKFSKQEKKYSKDIATRKKQQSAIDKQIKNAIKKEIELARKKAEEAERLAAAKAKAENKPVPTAKPKTTGSYLTATPESAKLSAAFENNRGALPWPVAHGTITESFGRHQVGKAGIDNNGVNISTNEGAAIRSVFNGKVMQIFNLYGAYVVMIQHGEYFTVYQNLHSVSVKVGDNVATKQTIGIVANSGEIPELQFQIWRGSVAQNPEAWIAK